MKKPFRILTAVFLVLAFAAAGLFYLFPLPGQIPVLMYHFVGSQKDAAEQKNFVSRDSFARQMAFLKKFGYRPISLEEYYEIKTGRKKPLGREVLITFDDGNYTFGTEALPILRPYRFPVTVFLVSESVKGGLHGSMTEPVIREILAKDDFVEIGSHSKTHPFLSKLPAEQLEDELLGSRKDLEMIFDRPIRFLAYPSGDLNHAVLTATERAGYDLAFTTSPKKLKGLEEGPFSLTRVKISRSSDLAPAFWFKLSGLYGSYKKAFTESPSRPDFPAQTRPLPAAA